MFKPIWIFKYYVTIWNLLNVFNCGPYSAFCLRISTTFDNFFWKTSDTIVILDKLSTTCLTHSTEGIPISYPARILIDCPMKSLYLQGKDAFLSTTTNAIYVENFNRAQNIGYESIFNITPENLTVIKERLGEQLESFECLLSCQIYNSQGNLTKGENFKILPLGIPEIQDCILYKLASLNCSWTSNLNNDLIPSKLKQDVLNQINTSIKCNSNRWQTNVTITQDRLECQWPSIRLSGQRKIVWKFLQTNHILLTVYNANKLITNPIAFEQPAIQFNNYRIIESNNSLTFLAEIHTTRSMNYLCLAYKTINIGIQYEFFAVSILKSKWKTEIRKFHWINPQFCENDSLMKLTPNSFRNVSYAIRFQHENIRYNTKYTSKLYFESKYHHEATLKFLKDIPEKEFTTKISEPAAMPEIPQGSFIIDTLNKELTIIWKPLPIRLRNGPIIQYSIQSSSHNSLINVSGDVNRYTFRNVHVFNPSIKVIPFTKTRQLSPVLVNSTSQLNVSQVSFNKENSYLTGYRNSTTKDRVLVWKLSEIVVSRYTLYYCIAESANTLATENCKVSNDSDWYGLKTIIVPNTTNYHLIDASLLLRDQIYVFGVSGEVFRNDKWSSTGIIPARCLYESDAIIMDDGPAPKIILQKSSYEKLLPIQLITEQSWCKGKFFHSEFDIKYCLLSSEGDCIKNYTRYQSSSQTQVQNVDIRVEAYGKYYVSVSSVSPFGVSERSNWTIGEVLNEKVLKTNNYFLFLIFVIIAIGFAFIVRKMHGEVCKAYIIIPRNGSVESAPSIPKSTFYAPFLKRLKKEKSANTVI